MEKYRVHFRGVNNYELLAADEFLIVDGELRFKLEGKVIAHFKEWSALVQEQNKEYFVK